MTFYCSFDFLFANLFIILIENKCVRSVTYEEVHKFLNILDKEAQSRGIILRGINDEYDYEYEGFFWKLKDEIICGSKALPSLLMYHFRIRHTKELVDILISKNVETNTLKMMGCEEAKEKHKIDIQDDIKWVNEQIDYRASLRQFGYCIEYQEQLEKLERIKERFPELSQKYRDRNIKPRINKKEGN